FLDKLNMQEAGKNDSEKQFQLQKEQMEFEKMVRMYQDTSKPKKINAKRKDDGKEMNDKDDNSDAKLREMAEYRAMLQKEREKEEKKKKKKKEDSRKRREKNKSLKEKRKQGTIIKMQTCLKESRNLIIMTINQLIPISNPGRK